MWALGAMGCAQVAYPRLPVDTFKKAPKARAAVEQLTLDPQSKPSIDGSAVLRAISTCQPLKNATVRDKCVVLITSSPKGVQTRPECAILMLDGQAGRCAVSGHFAFGASEKVFVNRPPGRPSSE